MSNKAIATINMSFNNGSFKKGKIYQCRLDADKNVMYITTEEGKEQELTVPEFDLFFDLLEIVK